MIELKPDDHYETPPDLFDALNQAFGPFHLDVCASTQNTKVEEFYSLENGQNSLELPWRSRNFCNPPYSRGNKDAFIRKAFNEARAGLRTTMIIPFRPGTATYKACIWGNPFVYQYPIGRIKFWLNGQVSPNSGRDDIVVVVFYPQRFARLGE